MKQKLCFAVKEFSEEEHLTMMAKSVFRGHLANDYTDTKSVNGKPV